MNKIGFQNFRRFQNFEPIEYREITFLVGPNNSGKSTLVKALLLIDNYFKSGNFNEFSFGNNVLEDANIVTYGRAINSQAWEKKENFIHFKQQIENFSIDLWVSGKEDNSFGDVHTLSIRNTDSMLHFRFELQSKFILVTREEGSQVNETSYKLMSRDIQARIAKIEKQLTEGGYKNTSTEYIELVSQKEKINKELEELQKNSHDDGSKDQILFSLQVDFDFGKVNSLTKIVDWFLSQSKLQYEEDYRKIQNSEPSSDRFEDLRALKEFGADKVQSIFCSFMEKINNFSIAYLEANSTKQSALFLIRDKSNALAQAIHEYRQLNIAPGEKAHSFILKWMKEFEVGNDFTIAMQAGEAYEMKIGNMHLADKGLGAIQAMLLIMRIACAIGETSKAKKYNLSTGNADANPERYEELIHNSEYNTGKFDIKKTVIIEEPELNLHPSLQSKLADLFHDVHKKFQINFIVETHSEYLIRKTQLIVKESEYEVAPNENPFSVIYFDKEFKQWPMQYRKDGKFIEDFGKGFYDESALLTLELL